jgi:hypothetical protein
MNHLTVAQRAHNYLLRMVADLIADRIVLHPLQAVNEAEDAGDRRQDQHVRVEAEPCEVDADLHAEVVFDVVERLVLPEFLKVYKC